MLGYKKRKKRKRFEIELLAYLTARWRVNHNPRLRDIVYELRLFDLELKQMLVKALRHLRVIKVLDGYCNPSGIYRIGEFK